jgi:hypothetical protein
MIMREQWRSTQAQTCLRDVVKSMVLWPYKCSLLLNTLCNFLNKISEITCHIIKSKTDGKIGFVNEQILNL